MICILPVDHLLCDAYSSEYQSCIKIRIHTVLKVCPRPPSFPPPSMNNLRKVNSSWLKEYETLHSFFISKS